MTRDEMVEKLATYLRQVIPSLEKALDLAKNNGAVSPVGAVNSQAKAVATEQCLNVVKNGQDQLMTKFNYGHVDAAKAMPVAPAA